MQVRKVCCIHCQRRNSFTCLFRFQLCWMRNEVEQTLEPITFPEDINMVSMKVFVTAKLSSHANEETVHVKPFSYHAHYFINVTVLIKYFKNNFIHLDLEQETVHCVKYAKMRVFSDTCMHV